MRETCLAQSVDYLITEHMLLQPVYYLQVSEGNNREQLKVRSTAISGASYFNCLKVQLADHEQN